MPTVNSSMQGKICMVTGANSGIGKATALALAQMGATVVMVCRDRARGEEARSEITTKSRKNAVDLLQADLSSQQSIRQLVETFQHHYTHLHVLINNAGASFPERRETVDGLEMTFAVNYLASFLLTNLLLDVLKASAPARIVNVSSHSHEAGYIAMDDLQPVQSTWPPSAPRVRMPWCCSCSTPSTMGSSSRRSSLACGWCRWGISPTNQQGGFPSGWASCSSWGASATSWTCSRRSWSPTSAKISTPSSSFRQQSRRSRWSSTCS